MSSENEPLEDDNYRMLDNDDEGKASTLDLSELGDRALLKLTKYSWFKIYLILSCLFALAEPILIAFPETIKVQIIILGISSGLWAVGILAMMVTIYSDEKDLGFLSILKESILPETLIEIVCFIFGWAFIFHQPSISCLRCLRIFRFFWYSEEFKANDSNPFYFVTLLSHLIVAYLEKIGQELFSYSSKGAVVVLGFFFYLTFVFGNLFWQETSKIPLTSPEGGVNGTLSECDTMGHCVFVMMRLTFFDGDGFDFVKSLMDANLNGLATLAILFMCVTAFVLLNGIIGIIGDAFNDATEDSDDDKKDSSGSGKKDSDSEKASKKKGAKKDDDYKLSDVDEAIVGSLRKTIEQMSQDLEEIKKRIRS